MGIAPRNCLTLAVFAALFAVTMRAVVPIGFMPGVDSDGKIVVKLCSAHGPSFVLLDADERGAREPGVPRKAPGDSAIDELRCLFASISPFARPEFNAWSAAREELVANRLVPAPADSATPSLAAPPPWLRGPPRRL